MVLLEYIYKAHINIITGMHVHDGCCVFLKAMKSYLSICNIAYKQSNLLQINTTSYSGVFYPLR